MEGKSFFFLFFRVTLVNRLQKLETKNGCFWHLFSFTDSKTIFRMKDFKGLPSGLDDFKFHLYYFVFSATLWYDHYAVLKGKQTRSNLFLYLWNVVNAIIVQNTLLRTDDENIITVYGKKNDFVKRLHFTLSGVF